MPKKSQKSKGGQAVMSPASSLIQKTRGVCGGKARASGTRIPVWGLENARRIGLSIDQIIERYPSVSKAQIVAAWKYAEQHRDEIDRQILDSQEC